MGVRQEWEKVSLPILTPWSYMISIPLKILLSWSSVTNILGNILFDHSESWERKSGCEKDGHVILRWQHWGSLLQSLTWSRLLPEAMSIIGCYLRSKAESCPWTQVRRHILRKSVLRTRANFDNIPNLVFQQQKF